MKVRTPLLQYFKIEFYRGIAPFGAFTHVLANDGDDAAILAKAQRLSAGITDTVIEHIGSVHDKILLAKVQPLADTGFPRIIRRLKSGAYTAYRRPPSTVPCQQEC